MTGLRLDTVATISIGSCKETSHTPIRRSVVRGLALPAYQARSDGKSAL